MAVLLAFGWCAASQAAVIYVDSRVGSDRFDGFTLTQINEQTGPVRTLRRAMQLVAVGDQVYLVNNNDPYMGGVSLAGAGQSGSPSRPIEIIGNGSIITGAKPIDPTAWRLVGDDLWRITPLRKGWYQLILDDVAVPEVDCPPEATTLPEVALGSWCAFQGAIYFRSPPGVDPRTLDMQLADEPTGLTLVGVENVVIRDITIRHFQKDGVHLAGRCRNVVLDNVTVTGNGRAGVVVRGSSRSHFVGTRVSGNRKFSLLIDELGSAESSDTEFQPEPTLTNP